MIKSENRTVHITSDGQEYDSYEEAAHRQKALEVQALLAEGAMPKCHESLSVSLYIVDCFDEIKAIMEGQK